MVGASLLRRWLLRSSLGQLVTTGLAVALLAGCHSFVGIQPENAVAAWRADMTSRLRQASAVSSLIDEFYTRRSYRPAWLGPTGLLSQANELIGCLEEAGKDGLFPSDYGIDSILALTSFDLDPVSQPRLAADLEFRLTSAFLDFSDHLLRGRLEPGKINSEWQVGSAKADLAGVLQTALDLNRVRKTLLSLRPQQEGYARLQEALVDLNRITAAGGWGEISPEIATAARSARVPTLARRLRRSGDLPAESGLGGDAIAAAISRFQDRHGLEATGAVDEKTRVAMSIPASSRADQVRANLERWRWLPHELGSRSVVVRIADFEIDLIEDIQVVKSMRAVVGRPYRRTPLFSSYMTHVVFQPTWNIPRRIAAEEILPILQRDEGYLRNRGISVLDNSGQIRVEPVSWSAVAADAFNYQLVQSPGPFNPLGRVKFTFPNSFQIAIHDTPQKDLFSERVRDFSHGCIRAEDSAGLAAFVLADDSSWNESRIAAALTGSQTQTVRLREPVPVYVFYWTVWVDDGGSVQFRRDLYDIDRQLIEALSSFPRRVGTQKRGE